MRQGDSERTDLPQTARAAANRICRDQYGVADSGCTEPRCHPARHTLMRLLNLVPVTLVTALALGCSAASEDAGEEPAPSNGDSSVASAEPGQGLGTSVTLAVGHCFVEPLRVAGREWVTKRLYVGYGGGLPRDFTEEGRFLIRSATTATFVADGGAQIGFKVAPGPLPQRGCR
jgi:hypothetical protein